MEFDIIWLLFNTLYFFFILLGFGLVVLFFMRFKPTAKIIKNLFDADIDWN